MGLEESRTAAQHKCQQDFSSSPNFLHMFLGALITVFISAICCVVSHNSPSRKSSSTLDNNSVAT